jgi:hypothetical protein
VPVSYFYDSQENGSLSMLESVSEELLINKEGAELLRAFNAVNDKEMRLAILNVAHGLRQGESIASNRIHDSVALSQKRYESLLLRATCAVEGPLASRRI